MLLSTDHFGRRGTEIIQLQKFSRLFAAGLFVVILLSLPL